MADSHLNSSTKTEVYESLYLICQATQQITEQLDRLRSVNVLKRVFADINKETALQLRAEVTTAAVHYLTNPEIADAHRHESKRIQLLKTLEQDGLAHKPQTGRRRTIRRPK